MIRRYIREDGVIRRRDVIELCHLGEQQATRLLRKLTGRKILVPRGVGKGTFYISGAAT